MLRRMLLACGFLIVSNVVLAATDQNSSVSYDVSILDSYQISATGLTSSDTAYAESKCVGGKLTLTDVFKTARRNKTVDLVVIYKIQIFNQGTSTVDASVLVFNEDFTSPGDNVAWAMADGDFSLGYRGRVDLPQTAQVEGGGDTYAESVETNMVCDRGSNSNLYLQVVKNKVGPVSIGGDTRSASADCVVRVFYHQVEK